MTVRAKNFVTQVPAAPSEQALQHFQAKLAFETDCWDVHAALQLDDPGFVLLDVRSSEAFERGHLPGAVSIPRSRLTPGRLEGYPAETLFVVYCAGPHCNGSSRAAAALAAQQRPVKEMLGGTEGWVDEGFHLVAG